ncbi:MAG: lon [Ilumatobacteraceae bacterium]|nr:lon [Ilumatobacteraceae bacterium]
MADPSITALTLPVLPLPDAVAFPGTVVTITLDSEAARAASAAANESGHQLFLLPEIDGRTTTVGVIGSIEQAAELPNGTRVIIVRTLQRALVVDEVASERSGRWMHVEPLTEARPTPRVDALGRELRALAEGIAEARRSRRLPEILRTTSHPGELADGVTGWSDAGADHRLTVLELTELGARLEYVVQWAKDYLGELNVSAKIRDDVTEGMEKQQRDYLLRQQLAAIRKELGEEDASADDYRAKLDELGNRLPDGVRSAVLRELDRLERTSGQSPEQSWIRTWLDRVFDLPWAVRSDDQVDIPAAREVLDADHAGLDDVKDRIIEFLAVRKLRSERAAQHEADNVDSESSDTPAVGGTRRNDGAIILLAGPPGVGKTSLGESVARAMGRNFVRVALGGVRDEAEIRGHRRTYVGAQPGRIVRAIGEAKSMNPVVLLDEVDKLSAGGWSGDPTAALLEVLDPAQNHTFRDHYLEVELDLSDVVFLATANTLETIPAPLLDRMEVVVLDGYTEDEKLVIARHHLLPRQIERNGLRPDEITITDEALRGIISGYTREAGVRSLERELGTLLRKVAAQVAIRLATAAETPIVVDETDLTGYLRRPKVHHEVADRVRDNAGVATGLAVTGAGGDVLFIEVSTSPGEPGLTLTGQLGDVMKESAQIALSWVRAHLDQLGLDESALQQKIHVHVPAGAVPKDGPSAGVTMTTALVSALTGRHVRPEIAMTGEVTLQGKVLPIGGVKQKVLAAHRSGVTEVILPRRNEDDIDDVPQRVRDVMTFHIADNVSQVLDWALLPAA